MGKEEASGPYLVGRTSLPWPRHWPMLVAKAGMVPMERLTAEDQVMLWPDKIWPQDIGALAVFDGSSRLDADGRFRIEAVREVVAARLHLAPRFRQLLYVLPRRLGGPLWVDAATFDLGEHIAALPLPAPGDEAQRLRTVE